MMRCGICCNYKPRYKYFVKIVFMTFAFAGNRSYAQTFLKPSYLVPSPKATYYLVKNASCTSSIHGA